MSQESKLDPDKIDDAVLALLLLGLHGDRDAARAWKSHDWAALGRLFEKGYICDPGRQSKISGFHGQWTETLRGTTE